MKKHLIIILGVLLLATTLVVAGCCKSVGEKTAEKAIEEASGGQADVDFGTNTVKVNTNEGTLEIGEGVSLPSGFPSDVHVTEGTITAASTATEDKGYTVSIASTKSTSALKTEYQNKLVDDGWNITSTMEFEGGVFLGAEKDDRSLSVSIGKQEDGKTIVTLLTSKTEK